MPDVSSLVINTLLFTLATLALSMPLGTLVVPPGVDILSIRIFNLVHYGVQDQVAGICLALVILLGLVAAAVAWLAPRL